jgi:hypothetical protein
MSFDFGGGPGTGLPGGWGTGTDPFIVQLVYDVYAILVQVATFLWNVITLLARILVGIFHHIHDWLQIAWQNFLKKAIDWLGRHIKKILDWLHIHIKKAIDLFQKWKKWYDTHILPMQLRLIKMIQMVRRFLGILRLFHVKWAAKADATLADLQNKIEESISVVRGTLNQIINTLAIAFDPTMLLTSNVLAASLLGNLGAVKRIFMFGSNRIISATEQATMDFNRTRYNKGNVQNHLNTLATSGPTTADQNERSAARAALVQATGAPLPF